MNFVTRTVATVGIMASMSGAAIAQSEPTAETVLATVNGTQITLGHVVALVERLPDQYQQIDTKELFNGILDQIIQQTLLAEKADTETARFKLVADNERRALLTTTAIDQIVAEGVTEEALQAAFDEQYGETPEEPEFNASHILVETEEEAKELVKALEGGHDFAELAKEKSTGPSGPSGGELGWFGLGAMVPEFEAAVVEMDKDAISAPVKTQFGWHVLKLNDKRIKPPLTLADVREEVADPLRRAAIDTAIEELESSATIVRNTAEIDPEIIRNSKLLDQK